MYRGKGYGRHYLSRDKRLYSGGAGEAVPLRRLGFRPVPGPAETGDEKLQPGHFRLGWDKLVGLVRGLDDGETVAFLHYLLVDPAYQGQHIGQELMERILEKHKHMLHVKIMPSDPKTIPFYERFGFVAGGSYTAMELNQMQ